jgi:SAM-dependent methyltransferase
VLDGIPMLMPDVRATIAGAISEINARDDLSHASTTMLGDCAGPGSAFETSRFHQSTYVFDHYGEFFPGDALDRESHTLTPDLSPRRSGSKPTTDPNITNASPSGVVRCLREAMRLAGDLSPGPILDVGCSVGRSTLELAAPGRTVLGLDASFGMLRLAQRIMQTGKGAASIRRTGLVYDRVEWTVPPVPAGVDFWGGDAAWPPFRAGAFAAVVALNVLDCLNNPAAALLAWARVLPRGGKLLLATPFDWSPAATPVDAWLGGHSQRGPEQGSCEAALRRHLAWAGFDILGESDVSWGVRLHDRATTVYNTFVVAAVRNAREPGSQT